MRVAVLIGLVTGLVASGWAHDPYEITSVVYVQSNRIELFMEMEFPTGMTLAGQTPTRDATVAEQFGSALPRLRALAGAFFDFTAGNHVVLPLRTNVELGVEDHLRFHVEFALTPHRPLRFVARGLGKGVDQSPYGTSLTVLDMVNQKVLGQTTLFAGGDVAEFPSTIQVELEKGAAPVVVNVPAPLQAEDTTPAAPPENPPSPGAGSVAAQGNGWARFFLLLAGAVVVVLLMIRWRRT